MKKENRKWDAVIVGAGIAGLGVARALVLKKKKVLIIEKSVPGVSSPNASGILDPFVDLDFRAEMLKLTLPALKNYGSRIKELEASTGLKTGYEKMPLLYCAFNLREEKKLKRFLKIPGVVKASSVKWLEREAVLKLEPELNPSVRGGLYLPVARVLPARLMKALKVWLQSKGAKFQGVSAEPQILTEKNRAVGIAAGSRTFMSDNVIGCLGAWAGLARPGSKMKLPVQAVRGQLYVYPRVKKTQVLLHTAGGGYLIPWAKGKLLAGSTTERDVYRTAMTDEGFRRIHGYAVKLLPELRHTEAVESWSGIRPRSRTGRPFIGKTRVAGYYVINGLYRYGILTGIHAGELMARLILTGKTPMELKPFEPKSKEYA